MLERLEMEGVGPSPRLSFTFKPRLNLLTGDNGLGKTFVLDLAWWALTQVHDLVEVPALPRPGWTGIPKVIAEVGGRHGRETFTCEVPRRRAHEGPQVGSPNQENVPVQVIAVTHSPLVLASIESRFDESQDALFMFDLVGSEVKVTQAEWRPRGDANAWLTSEVFDLKEPRSVEAEQAITQAKAALKNPGLPVEEARRIHNELHRLLKDTDPFWPRWLARAEAAGIEP